MTALRRLRNIYLVLGLLLPGVWSSYAQTIPAIDYLGIENGLSNSSVRCIYQDSKGFLWFGTYDGLNRYDGYDFKIFRNRYGDSSSVAHSWINTLTEDSNHRLWVGTRQGVSVYNPVTGNFSGVYYRAAGQKKPLKVDGYIMDIKTDRTGNVFVVIQNKGLVVFSKNSDLTGTLVPLTGAFPEAYSVQSICLDTDQKLWTMVINRGLYRYDPVKKDLRLINASLRGSSRMLFDKPYLWVANTQGLNRYNVAEDKYDQFYGQVPGGLTSTRITQLLDAGQGKLWITTDGGGINILDKASGKFSYISSGNGKYSLTSDAISGIYRDRESRMWIGTLRGGINILDPYKAGFQTISHEPANPNSLINNFVLSLFEESPGKLWIGTDGGGLSRWDRKTNRFTNYRHLAADESSLGGNFITSIKRDFTGTIWLASYEGGISRFIPGTGKFQRYNGINGQGAPSIHTFWLLYEDRQRNLWAGSLQNGMLRFNRENNRFELFDASLKDILVLKEDQQGQLWGGEFSNLVRIDAKNKKYRYYPMDKPVRAIFEDKNGDFWIGTEGGGLILFDRKTNKIVKRYSTDDGLGSNHVLTIQDDAAGNLWMSTYNGLSRFDIRQRTFKTYSESDGLQSKEFNFNAALTLQSGELAFGGIKGLSLFFPEKIYRVRNDPSIVFTGMKVNNQPVERDPSYVSKRSNNDVLELKVPYDEAIFTFEFTAIQYPSAERISYRYRLDGWDRTWNNSGAIRSATYTRLAPGNYTFRVNCTNADGSWINKEISFRVVVLPPWYRTWWAYLLYVSISGLGIYGFLVYKFRQTRLEYEVKLAQANAGKQKVIQEKEREIHEKRQEFFTSISHEFRTPLSLIINPIKDMLMRTQPGGEDQDLNIIYRNARRLLSLVDQLLLFRKADSGISGMKVTPLDLNQLCREVYLCFKQQAKSAGIHYTYSTDCEEILLYADREKLEIILFNLVSNAIKFTPPQGTVTIKLTETSISAGITVTDSGSGIGPEVGQKLFEKFYQSKSAGKPVKAGFGIGLYLAKQFTEDHHGDLSYGSAPGGGTTFSLKLLKGNEHFPPEMISTDTYSESVFLEELVEPVQETNTADPGSGEVFVAGEIYTESKSILTIDDDYEIRSYIRSIFSPQYVVYEAPDAESGMILVKEKLPDVVICDVMLPGMNGIEWCSWLKQDPALSYIPVILLTASASSESKLKGLGCGADDYISKPFEKDLLIARVANLLNTRHNLRSYFYNEITLQSNSVVISEEYQVFLQKCIQIVEKHITDPNFNIKVLASEIGMSHSNLYRKVKSMSGYTINSFIRFIRLRKAAELLINTELNVNEVANYTGFNSIKYFRSQFFKLFGINPSDFSRRNRPVFKKRLKVKQ